MGRLPAIPVHRTWARRAIRALSRLQRPGQPAAGVERTAVDHARGLLVYTPNGGGCGAALLWIHGGGFVIGDPTMFDQFCAQTAADLDIVVVSARYRLAPEHPFPAALDDLVEAWQWLQRTAAPTPDPTRQSATTTPPPTHPAATSTTPPPTNATPPPTHPATANATPPPTHPATANATPPPTNASPPPAHAAADGVTAAAFGIDPGRVAIGGQSAGGGLAACQAQRLFDLGGVQPAAQWLFCPMLDDRTAAHRDLDRLRHRVWNNVTNRYSWGAYLAAPPGGPTAPDHAVAARRADLHGLPPAWIGVGDVDLFADEDRDYAERLDAAGVDTTLDLVPGAPHGFETWAAHTSVARAYLTRARAWLAARLTAPAPNTRST
jgi:acetyl esterase/lipase